MTENSYMFVDDRNNASFEDLPKLDPEKEAGLRSKAKELADRMFGEVESEKEMAIA